MKHSKTTEKVQWTKASQFRQTTGVKSYSEFGGLLSQLQVLVKHTTTKFLVEQIQSQFSSSSTVPAISNVLLKSNVHTVRRDSLRELNIWDGSQD
jgi:hypothetical protein